MTTNSDMPELLPCPFCNGGNIPDENGNNDKFAPVLTGKVFGFGQHTRSEYTIYCQNCGIETHSESDKQEIIAWWNTRTDAGVDGGEVVSVLERHVDQLNNRGFIVPSDLRELLQKLQEQSNE